MKLPRIFLLGFLLVLSAHRLPAPISEIQETPAATPLPAKPKPRPKSTESESDPVSKSVRQFVGTWTGTTSGTGPNNTAFTYKKTLLISDRNAVLLAELTMTRPAGGT